jgi:xanthine dehydrogenase accessory factor
LRELGLADAELKRLRTPAGLDIGARGPEEIALSILAEIVSVRRRQHLPLPGPVTAVDPVCGMEVPAAPPSPSIEHDGRTVWFCCEGCRHSYERTHALSS